MLKFPSSHCLLKQIFNVSVFIGLLLASKRIRRNNSIYISLDPMCIITSLLLVTVATVSAQTRDYPKAPPEKFTEPAQKFLHIDVSQDEIHD